jgi:hypothetical protein
MENSFAFPFLVRKLLVGQSVLVVPVLQARKGSMIDFSPSHTTLNFSYLQTTLSTFFGVVHTSFVQSKEGSEGGYENKQKNLLVWPKNCTGRERGLGGGRKRSVLLSQRFFP